jgi:ribosome-associated heat shock protein Hsp15
VSETARIDVWLWRARFFKTRALAARAVAEGLARLSRDGASRALDKASVTVRAGDALTVWVNGRLRSVTVLDLGVRRGPAREAHSLYAEHAGELDGNASSGQTSRLKE